VDLGLQRRLKPRPNLGFRRGKNSAPPNQVKFIALLIRKLINWKITCIVLSVTPIWEGYLRRTNEIQVNRAVRTHTVRGHGVYRIAFGTTW
jgi:hypothetical protein